MAWPSLSDYSEALQNPRYAFSDPDLQNGSAIVNKLGQPRPISGNFATVFQVQSGNRNWAVRCFSREITDQQERYDAISRHLMKYNLPYMVGFKYLRQGIQIAGRWYPIIKMEWMKGLNLDSYIESNLQNPFKLQRLARQWIEICQSLRSSSIAHGDLQHGNIVITDADEIKLIDYDGIYIPDLIGKKGEEIGHRHYQHPSRISDNGISSHNFLNIDNFSSWVIATSLLLLQIDAALWARVQAGDESLIFRDVDYKAPERSTTLQLLANHPNTQARLLALRVGEVVAVSSFLEVPPLDKLETISVNESMSVGWLSDHLPNARKSNYSSQANTYPPNYSKNTQQIPVTTTRSHITTPPSPSTSIPSTYSPTPSPSTSIPSTYSPTPSPIAAFVPVPTVPTVAFKRNWLFWLRVFTVAVIVFIIFAVISRETSPPPITELCDRPQITVIGNSIHVEDGGNGHGSQLGGGLIVDGVKLLFEMLPADFTVNKPIKEISLWGVAVMYGPIGSNSKTCNKKLYP